jgi:L-serine dehydratase
LSIFEVMGPVMIGPSSSHTAGASKIGYFAKKIFGESFSQVEIHLYNSFAETGKGHGTDRAIIGGLLGMGMDDENLVRSFEIAAEKGLKFNFFYHNDPERHPNLAKIIFKEGETDFSVSGASIGGGKIEITDINGTEVSFSGRHEYLLLNYLDVPGMVGFIGTLLGNENINIAYLQISRDSGTGTTLALLKLDDHCPDNILEELRINQNIFKIKRIDKINI